MHVRLCWMRIGRNNREHLYSAAQLRAKLIDGDWDRTLEFIAQRAKDDNITHTLFVQCGTAGVDFAVLVPSDQIPAIWHRQRQVSDDLIASGAMGRRTKNHAANGSSPTIWLEDRQSPETQQVADVLWNWPGIIDVLKLPTTSSVTLDDSVADLPIDTATLGRDEGERLVAVRSGFQRDAKVRAAVLARADGRCERAECGESRGYPGFLDVHHILGIEASDRVWTCVALCPNCHREAHFSPSSDAINDDLRMYAERFAE